MISFSPLYVNKPSTQTFIEGRMKPALTFCHWKPHGSSNGKLFCVCYLLLLFSDTNPKISQFKQKLPICDPLAVAFSLSLLSFAFLSSPGCRSKGPLSLSCSWPSLQYLRLWDPLFSPLLLYKGLLVLFLLVRVSVVVCTGCPLLSSLLMFFVSQYFQPPGANKCNILCGELSLNTT